MAHPKLEDILAEVPRCPSCKHEGYFVVPKRKGKLVELVKVTCGKCGTDILDAFWTQRGQLP